MPWVESFSTLVAVLALKYPQHTPDFMAYQISTVRASRNFEDSSWVMYDQCYHSLVGQRQSLAANIASVKITHLMTIPIAPWIYKGNIDTNRTVICRSVGDGVLPAFQPGAVQKPTET